MEQKEKFYKKTWFAIVMTIFIYPIGMFLVWTNKNLSQRFKLVSTILGGIFFVILLAADSSAPEITINGESTLSVYKDEALTSEEVVASAVSDITDNRSDMTTADIIVEDFDSVDFTTEGEYKVSFVAFDEAENEARVPYTIKVELSEEQIAEKEAAEKEAAEKEENANRENEKALKSAQNYIKIMAFSADGLRGQLEFEGFTDEQIDYAIDNVDVDWNEEAVQSATSYSNTLNMSSNAIYDQLLFEGFTAEQAQYGIDNY